MGFLKEPSNHYAAYVASIHLAALRFCLLMIAKFLHQASGIAEIRSQLAANATSIDYAARLWQVFRAVIAGALDELKALLGDMLTQVIETIERHVQSFFVQARLDLARETARLELEE